MYQLLPFEQCVQEIAGSLSISYAEAANCFVTKNNVPPPTYFTKTWAQHCADADVKPGALMESYLADLIIKYIEFGVPDIDKLPDQTKLFNCYGLKVGPDLRSVLFHTGPDLPPGVTTENKDQLDQMFKAAQVDLVETFRQSGFQKAFVLMFDGSNLLLVNALLNNPTPTLH